MTKVAGSHTFKVGAELAVQGNLFSNYAGVTLATGVGPTSQPYTNTTNLNGFWHGTRLCQLPAGRDYTSTTQTPQEDYRLGKSQWAAFIQDSWKVTRRLTVDYGLRYDLGTATKETYGRLGRVRRQRPQQQCGRPAGRDAVRQHL